MSDNIRPLTSLHCPVFLVNSRHRHFTAATKGLGCSPSPIVAPLLPKLRGNFAEFLLLGYLEHLRLLASSTCVGLRYDSYQFSFRGFSWQPIQQVGLFRRTRFLRTLGQCLADFPTKRLTVPTMHIHQHVCFIFCVTPSVKQTDKSCGILTTFPSPTPFGLGLGVGLP